jgi:hypothetical protein
MDIQHRLNATAVLTLGKDMTFRDYAQGAFRMRGIGKGQTIRLFIIPEVQELITRNIRLSNSKRRTTNWNNLHEVLVDVSTWLVINLMRSEKVQFNMLCEQNIANVYRKRAFGILAESVKTVGTKESSSETLKTLELYRERLYHDVDSAVPTHIPFAVKLADSVRMNKDFIVTDEQKAAVSMVEKMAGIHLSLYIFYLSIILFVYLLLFDTI